jgi:hypothetical protein
MDCCEELGETDQLSRFLDAVHVPEGSCVPQVYGIE